MIRKIWIIAFGLLLMSCKTVNIYVLQEGETKGNVEVLIEQEGSDVESRLKNALK